MKTANKAAAPATKSRPTKTPAAKLAPLSIGKPNLKVITKPASAPAKSGKFIKRK